MMKPQDVAVLVHLVALGRVPWTYRKLAASIGLSVSELSASVGRSTYAGLVHPTSRVPVRAALLEFLVHGLRYVFPVQPGAPTRGVPTGLAAPHFAGRVLATVDALPWVWPSREGTVRGVGIDPVHPLLVSGSLADPTVYGVAALVEAQRAFGARERREAAVLLDSWLRTLLGAQ